MSARVNHWVMAVIGVGLLAASSMPARAGLVQVDVTGIAEAKGHVRVSLCTRNTFLTEACPYQADAPATLGSTVVTIAEVPPGEYAVQAFHDETDQGVVHQNFLGIPRERIGFSNDAPVRLRGPRFLDAAFQVGPQINRITLKVRHIFRGGS